MSKTEYAPEATDAPPLDLAVGYQVDLVLGPLVERWYCVNNIGVATLCKDKADAIANAKNCDSAYPAYGPHRAALLGDVASERERWQKAAAAALEVLDDPPPWSNAGHACNLLREAQAPNVAGKPGRRAASA